MEFQRIHRVGKKNTSSGKPRQIIARFLRYPDREEVMSNAKKLKVRILEFRQTSLKK